MFQDVARDKTAGQITCTVGRSLSTKNAPIERTRAQLRVRSRLAIIRTVLLEVITIMQEEHARQLQRMADVAPEAVPAPEGDKQDAGDS